MPELHDFDAAFAEAEARGERRVHPFKFKGEVYRLPPQPPLAFMVAGKALDSKKDKAAELDADDLTRLLSTLFTRTVVDRWVEDGIDVDQMDRIVRWAMEQWGVEEQEEGSDPPPTGTAD